MMIPRTPKKKRTGILACLVLAMIASGLQAQTPASLEEIFRQISTFGGGIDSGPYWLLRDYVYARKDDPSARAECEGKLLAFLSAQATPVAKMAACRMLRIIGSERSVPVLEPLLLDTDAADMALYALAKIPSPAVDKALLQTLPKAEGATKTAIIAALGDRKSKEAIPALVPLLKRDGADAASAALALGEIGGSASADALSAFLPGAPPGVKPKAASALMKCAEAFLYAKNARAALRIYDSILNDRSIPAAIREGAMIGRISSSGSAAASVLMDQLKGSDTDMQEAAIAKISEVIKPDAIDPVCGLLPSLSPAAQVQVLAVLSGYPKERVLATIVKAAGNEALPVRVAAIKALETVGDASVVPLLAGTAARTRGAEQIAARGALGLLKGKPVDEAVLALYAQKPPEEIQGELLLAIAERRMYAAKNMVAAAAQSPVPRIRTQALRALRSIGTPSDISGILDLLVKSADDAERIEVETTIAALAQKIANPENRSAAVKTRLGVEKDPVARARLLRVLHRIGDDSSLPLLRAALGETNPDIVDAAARALSAWPTTSARDDVIELARKSASETHRLLALQGFLRMINLDRHRRPDAAVADLRQAYFMASRTEEKRLILSALARFACPEALDLAGWYLGDNAVKAEAQAAIDKLKARLTGK
jgi:HEAT repeat protein